MPQVCLKLERLYVKYECQKCKTTTTTRAADHGAHVQHTVPENITRSSDEHGEILIFGHILFHAINDRIKTQSQRNTPFKNTQGTNQRANERSYLPKN